MTAHWALAELGLDYRTERVRTRTGETETDAFTRINPRQKIPVLQDGDITIAESAAIVEWICANHAPEMIPAAGTKAALEHLQLMHFAEGSAMTPILLNLYVGRLGEAGAPLQARIQQQLASHFGYMESILRPSGHFVLDELSAADVMLSFPADVAIASGAGAKLPKLAKFVVMIHTRPAYQRGLEKGGAYRFA